MGRPDFNMLDVGRAAVDASSPGNDRVVARIDRDHASVEQNLIAQFDFGRDGVNVDASAAEGPGNHRVLGSADHGSSKSDDLFDQVGALARQLAGEIAAEAPANQMHFLIASPGQRGYPLQYPRQGLFHSARIPTQAPAACSVTEHFEIGLENGGGSVAGTVAG